MKYILKWVAAIAVLMLPLSAHALFDSCTVTTTGITFPAYASPGSSNANGMGDIAVTCSALVVGSGSYTIALGTGSGTYTNRTLKAGTNSLSYNIYTDGGFTIVWGDGSGATQKVSDSYSILLLPVTRHYTAHGSIPGSQNKPAGTYTDTVTVTVTY